MPSFLMAGFSRPSRSSPRTDFTIEPPKNRRFSRTKVSCLLDTRKDSMKKALSNTFMFAKVYRAMSSGRQGARYFRRYGREPVSKRAISLKKSWGGYRRTSPRHSRPRCRGVDLSTRCPASPKAPQAPLITLSAVAMILLCFWK